MTPWSRHPTIYEINACVWLHELSEQAQRSVTLGNVPTQIWDGLASYGCDAVWLMGVWNRSPAGIAVSMRNDALVNEFRRLLPDFTAQDNVGSAYCVKDYRVDARLGGPKGLAQARSELAARGMRLVLDFVPNHVAPDHLWATRHPEYFIQGTAAEMTERPGEFLRVCGKPPSRRSCRSLTSATGCAVIWPCCCSTRCLNAHGGNAPVPCRRPSI